MQRGNRQWHRAVLLATIVSASSWTASRAADRIDSFIAFQGRLTTAAGAPVAEGAYDLVFRFYDAPVGGRFLLADEHGGPAAVPVRNSTFTVRLGTGRLSPGLEPGLSEVFVNHVGVHLAVSVRGEPELEPRIPIGSTAYAFQAGNATRLGGRTPAEFLDQTTTPQTKAGRLTVSAAAPLEPALEVVNTAPDGSGLLSVATGAGPALTLMSRGNGPLIVASADPQEGEACLVVSSRGEVDAAGGAAFAGDISTAGTFRYSTPRIGHLTLTPADFRPRHPFEEQYVLWGYPFKPTRHYLVSTREDGYSTFYAPVHLPEGAVLRRLVAYINDSDPAKASKLVLSRPSLTGADAVAVGEVASRDGTVRVESLVSGTVDTSDGYYVLSLVLHHSGRGNMQFYGARLEYSYSHLSD